MLLVESQCCPPISLFVHLSDHDAILIEKHENYQKRSYRNRFYINSPQGKIPFAIPLVKGKNQQQLITDVQISYDQDWIRQLYQMIRSNYGSAPYFEYYFEDFINLFLQKHEYLFSLNKDLLNWIFQKLEFDKKILYTNYYAKSTSKQIDDFRNVLVPNRKMNHIKSIRYAQVFEEKNNFIDDLSIIDLIFCCGPEGRSLINSK